MAKKTTTPTSTDNSADSIISENIVLKLTIPADEAKAAFDRAVSVTAKSLKVPGFRQGKAPRQVVQEQVNPEHLIEKTLSKILPTKVEELLKKENKKPVTYPAYNVTKADLGEDWEVEVIIAEKPAIKLGKYQDIIIKAKKTGKANWDKHLAEHKADKSDGHDHDHGEEAEESSILQEVFRQLIEEIKPKVPELWLRNDTQRQIEDMAKRLEQMKLSIQDYLQRTGQSEQDFTSQVAAQSLGQIQLDLILDAIAEDQKLEPSEAELDTAIAAEEEKVRHQIHTYPYLKDNYKHTLTRRKLTKWFATVK